MKKIYILLTTLIIGSVMNSTSLFAQPNAGSVSTSSMGTAVGEFTGTLNLNFPLASASNGNVGAGLTLGYIGTGYKPNSPSSEVGMDWYMSTGFSVTRQIMHLPDEYNPAFNGYGDDNYDSSINCNLADGEMDLYTFNGFGQSINFTVNVDSATVFIINQTEIKIIPLMINTSFGPKVDQFQIINIDGNLVTLTPIHQELRDIKYGNCSNPPIFNNQNFEITTLWSPISIQGYDLNSNRIDFIYDSAFRQYQFQGLDIDVIKGRNKQLLSIRGLNDTIDVNYLQRFDITSTGSNGVQGKLSSVYYKNSSLCYYYEINSDFYGATTSNAHQIRLNSIQKKACDNSIMEPRIDFTYLNNNQVSKNITGIDHWGFRNQHDANNADNMIPTEFGGGANRSIDTTRVRDGILTSVKDVNGKTTTFTYEPHRIAVSPNTVNAGSVSICNITTTCTYPATSTNWIMMNYNTGTQVDGTVGVNSVYGNYNSSVTLTFFRGNLGSTIQITRSWNAYSVGGQTYTSFKLADLLDNSGNPFFVSGFTYHVQMTGVNVSAQMNYTYLTPGVQVVGGVRIKSINEGGEITNYDYTNGMLYNEPNYYEKFPTRWVTAHHQTLNLNYMSGAHIGYGEVTVSKSGLGRTVSKFKTTFTKEVLSGKRNVCDLLIQGIGNLESKTIFDHGNTEISKDIFTYRVDILNYGISNNRVLQKTNCNIFGFNCTFWAIRYRYQQFLHRPLSKTSSMYGKLTSVTTYEYNHSHTIQPSVVKTNSQGNETLVYTNYTTDFWANSDVKNTLMAKNIKVPFSTSEWRNSKPIRSQRTDWSYYSASGSFVGNGGFSNPANIVRPSTLYKVDCDGVSSTCAAEYPDHYYHAYTLEGQVSVDQKPNWPQNVYTYNRKRLATSTTNGFVKSTTYYANSYLVSRITNPDGTFTDYEYDKLGRLLKQTEQPSNNRIEYEYFYSNVSPFYNIVVTKAITPIAVNGMTTRETRQFFNNHGRLIQTLQRFQPTGQDIADFIEYDANGRKIRDYLPYIGTSSAGNLIPLPSGTGYTETKYESSPLSRITEVIPPGWHATKYEYGLNNATDNVKNPQNVTSGLFNLWPADNLFKETVIDGNGNKVIKFTDFSGKLVCSRQTDFTDSSTGGKRKDTYTQYDNKNRPIKIYPPGATETTTAQQYDYTYDTKDRMTAKKIPSKGWMNYYYNARDLLAVAKDAKNQHTTYEYNTDGQVTKVSLSATLPTNLESPTNTSDLLKEFAYGTTGIEKGKLQWQRVRVLGSTAMIKSRMIYDSRGRLWKVASSNHKNTADLMSYTMAQNISLDDTLTNGYDQVSNLQFIKMRNKPSSALTVNYTTTNTFDHMYRLRTETFAYSLNANPDTSQLIANYSYNHRNELIQNVQGGGLQTLDYFYKSNGMLDSLNNLALSANDLFHYHITYDNPIMGGTNTLRKNGDISNIRYKVKNGVTRLNEYRYDEYSQLTKSIYYELSGSTYTSNGRFNEDFTYHTNGRINTVLRNGHTLNNQSSFQIDNLSYLYTGDNIRLQRVQEANTSNNNTQGHNQRTSVSTALIYDQCGNVTTDLHRAISTISYNHLHLPTVVLRSDNSKLEMTYDADGYLLCRKTFAAGGGIIETRDYIGGIELVNNDVNQINHSQGRLQKHLGAYRHEYVIKDHLGNTRVVYFNNGGTATIIDENHYYAYGMEYGGFAKTSGTITYNYMFNGIERSESFNLDFAFYRGLDPVLGVWMQVDPKAEQVIGMYPYCAMGNNPISQMDPDGDLPFLAVMGLIAKGAAIGVVTNGLNNVHYGKAFFNGAGKAALWGAISASVSFGIGELFPTETLINEFARAGAHSLAQGTMSHLQGGDFWHGAASGGISSLGGSAMKSLEFSDHAMTIGSAALGGLGSKIAGGDFWQGFGTGMAVGGFNHEMHKAIQSYITDAQLKKIYKNYPKAEEVTRDQLFEKIGGPLKDWYEKDPDILANTCAIRLSYALNKSGYLIEKSSSTFNGSDGLNYYIAASNMHIHLTKLFGTGILLGTKTLKNGLYSQKGFGGGVTGHVDIMFRGNAGTKFYSGLQTTYWH